VSGTDDEEPAPRLAGAVVGGELAERAALTA
jgi:hypothetical protein